MNMRRLTGLALGLALPLTLVMSAAAADNEDYNTVRENLGVGSYDDYDEGTGVGSYDDYEGNIRVPVSTDDDDDDDEDTFDVDYGDYGDYDNEVRDGYSTLYDEVRDLIINGPSDDEE